MDSQLSDFYGKFIHVPQPNFYDQYGLPALNDEELKRFQQILVDPVFMKALVIVNQSQPSVFGSNQTDLEEAKILRELRGWKFYHHALLALGLPQKTRKARKELKVDYQDPDDNIGITKKKKQTKKKTTKKRSS